MWRIAGGLIALALVGAATSEVLTRGTGINDVSPEPITIADPLPADAVVIELRDGEESEPIAATPGLVIEFTYVGTAHPPCSTLQVLNGRAWETKFSMGGAWSSHPEAIFGAATASTDLAVIEANGFTLACAAMNMVGVGPERFRLPLWTPNGEARLCVGGSVECVPLDYG